MWTCLSGLTCFWILDSVISEPVNYRDCVVRQDNGLWTLALFTVASTSHVLPCYHVEDTTTGQGHLETSAILLSRHQPTPLASLIEPTSLLEQDNFLWSQLTPKHQPVSLITSKTCLHYYLACTLRYSHSSLLQILNQAPPSDLEESLQPCPRNHHLWLLLVLSKTLC